MSACAACASASSSVTVTTQFNLGPYFLSRSRYIFVSSVDVTSRRLIRAASVVTGEKARSSSEDGRGGDCSVTLISAPGVAPGFGFLPGK